MVLSEVELLAKGLMEQHGLIEQGWEFRFDRAVRRFGSCCHGTKTITLSKVLCEMNEEKEIKQTILHEIAHALVDRNEGHSKIWKAKAIEIGHSGDRCYSSKNVVTPERKPRNIKGTCRNCKREIFRRKRSFGLACGRCCRKLNNDNWSDDYLFEWSYLN